MGGTPGARDHLCGALRGGQAPGFETARLFLQGAVVTSSGEVRLLPAASVVVIDDAL